MDVPATGIESRNSFPVNNQQSRGREAGGGVYSFCEGVITKFLRVSQEISHLPGGISLLPPH